MYSKYLQFLGANIIGIYIYFRFIKKRLPTELFFYFYEDNSLCYNYYLIFLILFSCVFSSYMLLKLMQNYLRISYNYKIYFIKYIIIIVDFVKSTIISLYQLIFEQLSYEHIRDFCLFFQKHFSEKEKYFIFMFLGLPYIIIPLALFYDTFFFFTLNYFYKTLYFFVLPLLYNMFLFILKDIVSNLELLDDEIDCIQISEDEIRLEVKDGFDDLTRQEIEKNDIPEYINLYSLNIFLDNLKEYENYYKSSFLLFMYVIYLFCWTYILSFNIITLFIF